MQDLFDYKHITKEMLDRVSNNPVEASGCIQSLCEYLARRDSELEYLYETIDAVTTKVEDDQDFINKILERYMTSPWYKRVWRALFRRL